MAFNPQQINPVDLNPNVGVGVNLPFNGPGVFTPNYLTFQSIKNNLINFFLTNPGEIPLNPSFGGGLKNFIFEQISENTLDFVKQDVNKKIENYFPSVIINSLDILRDNDNNSIVVQLKYSIQNTNINDTITLQF